MDGMMHFYLDTEIIKTYPSTGPVTRWIETRRLGRVARHMWNAWAEEYDTWKALGSPESMRWWMDGLWQSVQFIDKFYGGELKEKKAA